MVNNIANCKSIINYVIPSLQSYMFVVQCIHQDEVIPGTLPGLILDHRKEIYQRIMLRHALKSKMTSFAGASGNNLIS